MATVITLKELNEDNNTNITKMRTVLNFIKEWDGYNTLLFSSLTSPLNGPLEPGDLIWWTDDEGAVEIHFNNTSDDMTGIIYNVDDVSDKYTTSSNFGGIELNYKTDLVKLPYGIAALLLNEHPNKPANISFEPSPYNSLILTQKQHKQQLTNIYNALAGLTDNKTL
jgi:hypothetical protein